MPKILLYRYLRLLPECARVPLGKEREDAILGYIAGHSQAQGGLFCQAKIGQRFLLGQKVLFVYMKNRLAAQIPPGSV
jgi:hypothetical protein